MKQVVFSMACLMLFGVITLGAVTMSHRILRESEMETSLYASVRSVLDDVVEESAQGGEAAVASSFYELLLSKIKAGEDGAEDPGFSLEADVTALDQEKGILSVHVKETYTKPSGKIGEVECDATAFFDALPPKGVHTVRFYVYGDPYCLYEITDGEAFVTPPEPNVPGMKFAGWAAPDGSTGEFPDRVTEDQEYQAVFEEGEDL